MIECLILSSQHQRARAAIPCAPDLLQQEQGGHVGAAHPGTESSVPVPKPQNSDKVMGKDRRERALQGSERCPRMPLILKHRPSTPGQMPRHPPPPRGQAWALTLLSIPGAMLPQESCSLCWAVRCLLLRPGRGPPLRPQNSAAKSVPRPLAQAGHPCLLLSARLSPHGACRLGAAFGALAPEGLLLDSRRQAGDENKRLDL